MLAEIHVRHYALIEDVTVAFGPGLNLLTGETGAGKSILIDALTLLVGARASGDDVRQGEERAAVAARFALPVRSVARDRLAAMGIDAADEVILNRDVLAAHSRAGSSQGGSRAGSSQGGSRAGSSQGGSRAYLNGRPATVAMLREVAGALLEIHGQHEGQLLLRPQSHLDLLDQLGGPDIARLRGEIASLVARRQDLRREARALADGERDRLRRIDMLNYQIAEIDAAAPGEGEIQAVEARRAQLANVERLRAAVQVALGALDDEEHTGALDRVGQAAAALRGATSLDPTLEPVPVSLDEARALLAEAARDLQRYAGRLTADPEALVAVDDRLHLLRALHRKYGAETAGPSGEGAPSDGVREILRYREAAATELQALRVADERAPAIESDLRAVEAVLTQAASVLSALRADAGGRLDQAVERELAALGMPGTRFVTEISQTPDPDGIAPGGSPGGHQGATAVSVGPLGMDTVRFLIAPNPGEPLRPLNRIASGGELSRIMLALRTVLIASRLAVPEEGEETPALTLIFDEVDAGVGAAAATAVGQRLAALAREHQVLCITHQPGIASLADTHLQVYKYVSDGRTRVGVRSLDARERVDELARMLGGRTGSRVAREHAEELLQQAAGRRAPGPGSRGPRPAGARRGAQPGRMKRTGGRG